MENGVKMVENGGYLAENGCFLSMGVKIFFFWRVTINPLPGLVA
jgi:hypothetical protein